jgi:alkanesulfonate monooxygenase SsuD/methylene tetrahydromethanopterin reductase-like flavin-dependent oxidoreductase (luciferase family)
VAADTDAEAEILATSVKQFFLGVVTNTRKLLQPPVENMNTIWDVHEEAAVNQMLAYSFIGGPAKIRSQMESFLERTGVNEVMATTHIFDQQARIHSYRVFSDVMKQIDKMQASELRLS